MYFLKFENTRIARGAGVVNGGSWFGILCGTQDFPVPRLKKVLTRDFWVRHRWRAQKSRDVAGFLGAPSMARPKIPREHLF